MNGLLHTKTEFQPMSETNVRNQCRGEPDVRPPNKNHKQTDVLNQFKYLLSSDIGLMKVFVRRQT